MKNTGKVAGSYPGGARARLLRVFSAQIYVQMITIAVQLGLVPILLSFWGLKTYGTWLLVSAVPTYLAFSDLGFTLVAKNLMVIQVAAGDRRAALRTFQSVFALLNIVAPLVLLLTGGVLLGVNVANLIGVAPIDHRGATTALLLLIVAVLIYQYLLLVSAGIRSENRAAIETMLSGTIRLVEAVAIAVAAASGGGIVTAALATLLTRLICTVGMYLWLRRASPWLKLGHSAATRADIRQMLHPAIGFAVVPIGQALLIQGPLIVIGALIGPTAVVVLSTTRTLTRMGTSATNVLNATFVTEYAVRFGKGDMPGFANMGRRHRRMGAVVIGAYLVGTLGAGQHAIGVLTGGKVRPSFLLLALMVAGVACEMAYSTLMIPVGAANRHATMSYITLTLSFIGVMACYPLVHLVGLNGAAASLLTTQISILAAITLMVRTMRWKASCISNDPGIIS